jgi:predicted ATPase
VELRILGPLETTGSNGPIEIKAAKPRGLLALLALSANEVVSADTLVERLWAEPPPSAPKLLQVYVSQLRRALGQDGDRIVTRPPGYVLELAPAELDSERFELLLANGRSALEEGRAARARAYLGEALDLWRGPALADFAYEQFARAEAERLEELRSAALEERIAADLELGRHEELIGELTALTESLPLRERLWRQLMLALYRSGRQAEALECFAGARRALVELGLEPGPELRELQRAILDHDPALGLRRRTTLPTNLPAPLAPLLGRDRALDELAALVRRTDTRLITLTGAGGSGKTQLALELARRTAGEYADGTFVVELAPLHDPELVDGAIAGALSEGEAAGPAPRAADVLRGREVLLVLDNAEHLPDAWPSFVSLLKAASRLTLVVTSRVVLHLSGEHVYPVPPLQPAPASELFVARATAADPAFAPDPDAIADICGRVDNLPLAIELAATRVRTMSLELLRAALVRRLPLLTGGPRDLPARQQTLRDTIEWSYALLGRSEQLLLAQLSVFDGGFTSDAVEEVCGAPLGVLAALGDASLIRERGGGRMRFDLLETIREFAQEQLERRDEAAVRRRHADHFLRVAQSAGLTAEQTETLARHDIALEEQDNLRAAIAWSARNAPELALELCVALEQFWASNGPAEGLRWLTELIPLTSGAPAALRMRALRVFGGMTQLSGGDVAVVEASQREALAIAEELSDDPARAILLHRLAVAMQIKGDHSEGRRLAQQSLDLHRQHGSGSGEAQALRALGEFALETGDSRTAVELLSRSAEIARSVGFTWWEVGVLNELAAIARTESRLAEARSHASDALEGALRIGYRRGAAFALATLAAVAHAEGDDELAGVLWGAVESEQKRSTVSWTPLEPIRTLFADGNSEPFEHSRARGAGLSLEQAAAAAG